MMNMMKRAMKKSFKKLELPLDNESDIIIQKLKILISIMG